LTDSSEAPGSAAAEKALVAAAEEAALVKDAVWPRGVTGSLGAFTSLLGVPGSLLGGAGRAYSAGSELQPYFRDPGGIRSKECAPGGRSK
jgi:hypothetical protein